jgi:perosamine synthetase
LTSEVSSKAGFLPDDSGSLRSLAAFSEVGLEVPRESRTRGQKVPTVSRGKITLGRPVLLRDMEEAAVDALRNDRFVGGENVARFEEEFSRMVGTDFAISTSSGTNALAFILLSLGLKGRKVVTSPMSFIASANSIIHAGGEPVFGDVSEKDYCLDAIEAERQLMAGAKGVLPVHIYGQPADFDEFSELGKKYGIPVVEDACQAHGASYRGKMAGNLGIAAAFSFYPSKNMSVLGDGGMVTTNDESLAKSVAKLRDCGRSSRYTHDVLGYTSRLNSVNAAIGRVQLRHLAEWNVRRAEIAGLYAQKLKDLEGIILPPAENERARPVYHMFVIRMANRDSLKEHLERNGIECGVNYPIPIHLQPLYVEMFGYAEGAFPKSERFSRECLSLPMHPFLSEEDVDYVCEGIQEYFQGGQAS